MKRKIIALALAACMSFCLVSCNKIEQNVNVNTYDEQVNATLSQQNAENYENNVTNENVYPQQSSNYEQEHTNSPKTSPKTTTTKNHTTTTTQKKIATTTKSAHSHSFSAANCTQAQKCSCGVIIGSPLGHSYSASTCTSPKKCSRCGVISGSALGHNYQNSKCTRCGKTDPDSLPVSLHEIPLIDSSFYNSYFHYSYNKDFTDSFGNKYKGAHFYNGLWEEKYSIHNLNNSYSTFTGSIVASQNTLSGSKYCIEIYVDDVLKFSKNNFTKTTGSVPFSINVKGGYQLKIVAYDGGGSSDVTGMEIGIVNAKLYK